jgi:hypothetical protein
MGMMRSMTVMSGERFGFAAAVRAGAGVGAGAEEIVVMVTLRP